MSVYELAILGDVSAEQKQRLSKTISDLVGDFELALGTHVIIHDGASCATRDKRVAFAAVYFGGAIQQDQEIAHELLEASAPIIPTVSPHGDFAKLIPEFLRGANGLRLSDSDPELSVLAIALLECVGLLRRQRRVFVSYRRTESRSAAIQLHDLLAGRGFDVFLDTHDIRPGDPFQEVLWHRLCDSDVMVMLDTKTYFESKWTRQELGRARAKEIHVLRIVWPEHTPTRLTDLSETIYLDKSELKNEDGPIIDQTIDQIALAVENLRSRSIASRYMSMTGRLRAEAERIGATVEGVGAHRAISIKLANDTKVWAYPVVGIPTAELLHDITDKADKGNANEIPVLVYDHIGIREQWVSHLKWLETNISTVRWLKVTEAGWAMAAWEE